MANTPKTIFRGFISSSTTLLYSAPASTTAIVTNLVLSNTSATAATVTMSVGGFTFLPTVSVPANSIVTLDLRLVLTTTQQIQASSGTNNVIVATITGIEQT